MKIIIDTREQKPLVFTGHETVRRKLDEGDYATIESEPLIVIERKSIPDFYGSLIQGHARFKAEILRSRIKNKKFFIFIEGRLADAIYYAMKRGFNPETLRKIIATMTERYELTIIECPNRTQMSKKIVEKLREHETNGDEKNG